MRAYAILVTQNNELRYLMSKTVADMIKSSGGVVCTGGYSPMKYLTCILFATKAKRDNCADKFKKVNIRFETRDDAIVDPPYDKYLK